MSKNVASKVSYDVMSLPLTLTFQNSPVSLSCNPSNLSEIIGFVVWSILRKYPLGLFGEFWTLWGTTSDPRTSRSNLYVTKG